MRSATFPPVTARYFRLVLEQPAAGGVPVAAGIKPLVLTSPVDGNPTVAVSALQLFAGPRVNRAEEKAGYAPVPDFYALETQTPDTPAQETDAGKPGAAVGLQDVLDLTGRMGPDGSLDWAPKAGEWTVLRLGYSLTGHVNAPAPADATGLEVDKLDASLVQEYLETYLGFFEDAVGSGLPGITSLLSDSIESGPQNWTPRMREEFQHRRGYDLIPWLPALTGIIVESAERSDAFLWDYRRTIAELLADNHYGTLARLARERGLGYYAEALEDHRPQLGDDLEMRSHADVPMGAMWCYTPEEGPRQTYVADVQGAASVSHVYGKAATGAESMSAFGRPFQFTPQVLKPIVDMEFALGVNLLNIHTSPHQPDGVPKPGITLSPYLGQSFTRNDTWAHAAGPWISYLARCSHLLQQGTYAADVAYFYGEEAPVTGVFGDASPEVPAGYGFDFINLDGLLNHVTVTDDGGLLTTGGVRYRLLYLGGTSHRMTLAAVRRVTELLDAGATVAGWRPEGSPSAGDEARLWAESVDALWKPGRPG
ncbi:glycosyl hydrolase [Arthrobacter sp. UC242_113]|uniref:glycosyl hydrolase n=1 Tax=Arthrobacter sp. UC242_113 TaxID=3374550 RepID=UPI003757AD4D